MMKLISSALLTGFLLTTTALAADKPKAEASFRDWNVFSMNEGGEKVCFAVTEPKDKSPKNVNHGDVFWLISTWQSGAAKNQPSFMAGYPLQERSTPSVRVGSDKYDLYVSENEAFVESNDDEERLVRAMERGRTMTIQAVSTRGTTTTYEISLLGVSAAIDRMQEICS